MSSISQGSQAWTRPASSCSRGRGTSPGLKGVNQLTDHPGSLKCAGAQWGKITGIRRRLARCGVSTSRQVRLLFFWNDDNTGTLDVNPWTETWQHQMFEHPKPVKLKITPLKAEISPPHLGEECVGLSPSCAKDSYAGNVRYLLKKDSDWGEPTLTQVKEVDRPCANAK